MPVDVIGIGAQKAGTGWLWRILLNHPEFVGPSGPAREIDFFNFNWHLGRSWYEDQFGSGAVRGEFSVLYLADLDSPARAAAYNPDLRIILSLRDPVDRAVSHHRHELVAGRLPHGQRSFVQGLANNPTYVDHSRYATHLRRWLEHFPREQFHIVDFDQIAADPRSVARDLAVFCGIDPAAVGTLTSERPNQPRVYRSKAAQRLTRDVRSIVLRVAGPDGLDRVRRTGLPGRVRRAFSRPVEDDLRAEDLEVPDDVRSILADEWTETWRLLSLPQPGARRNS